MNGPIKRARRVRLNLDKIIKLSELADYIIPFTIRAVCELDVADRLNGGPKPVDVIAHEVGAHAPSLQRALRALACKGIFVETVPGVFAHSPMSELLASDHPLSLKDAFGILPADIAAWTRLDFALETGKSAFEHVHGQSYWDYLAARPEEARKFEKAQAAQTRLELRIMLRSYDWSQFETIVDVGGGNGTFLGGIAAKHASLHGLVYDSLEVTAQAEVFLGTLGLGNRIGTEGGNFLERVPPSADCYVLKRILYGLTDGESDQLLRGLAAAMKADSRLLIIEPVREGSATTEMSARYDLAMMVMNGCGARDLDGIGTLLNNAGMRLAQIIPTPIFPILEVVRSG